MASILTGGLAIGALCGAWLLITGVTGWYKDPTMYQLFIPVVTILEIVVLIWALRKTAAEGRTYSGQVVAGTLMALIGAICIFCISLLVTSVIAPNFFEDVNAMSRDIMRDQGQTEEQINAAIAGSARWQTHIMSALAGVIGTVMTGIVVSAVIAIWVRAREPRTVASR
jgi:hypothetical protein